MRAILFLLAGLLISGAARAHVSPPAATPGLERPVALGAYAEVFEDREGRLTVEQVVGIAARGGFGPHGGEVINFGYSSSAHWICFKVKRATGSGPVMIEIPFTSLDEIDLYEEDGRGAFLHTRGGDHLPFKSRGYAHRFPVFLLALGEGETREVFVRVRSDAVVTVPLNLWTRDGFERSDRRAQYGLGLFYGYIVALFLYNLMLFLSLRDRVYAYYVLYAASFGGYLFAFDGFAFELLWPESVWWANHSVATLLCLALAFGSLFARHFLELRNISPRGDALLKATTWGSFVLAVCSAGDWLLQYGQVLRLLSLGALVVVSVTLWISTRELSRGYRPAKFFLLAWSALLAAILVGALRNFALMPTNVLTLHGLHIGFAADILLLSFGLADRIKTLERTNREAQALALEHERGMRALTERHRQELEEGIAARTRELTLANERLRTQAEERGALLGRLQGQEARMQIVAQHDPLTGLPNRASLLERLRLACERARRSERKLAVLVIGLDRSVPADNSLTAGAADALRISAAGRLRAGVRASDTVARVRDDEFVILTGDLERCEDAGRVAEKMTDLLDVPVSLEGGIYKCGSSIGIAVFPDHAVEPESLLRLAGQAMRQAKARAIARYEFASGE